MRPYSGSRQPENPGAWAEQAACKGLVDMFAVNTTSMRGSGTRLAVQASHAIAVCHTCPVLNQCRNWALGDPDPAYHMVAGGLDPHQRHQLRKATA